MSISQPHTDSSSHSGTYYGWYIVAACFVSLGMAAGVAATFPVFFKPLIEEFHWSRTALSGAIAVNFIIGGLVTPFWGIWTDRSGARVVFATAAFFVGLFLLFLRGIGTLWHAYLLFSMEAAFVSGMSLIPASVAISQWFRQKRGVAMGIALTGEGVGGLIMAPLSNYLVVRAGWRNAYLLIAAIVWVIVIPIAALVMRRRPQDMGLLPDGEATSNPALETSKDNSPGTVNAHKNELTLQESLHKFSFWMIAIAFFLPMMAGTGIVTHMVAMFTDKGISSQMASTWLGFMSAFSIAGRFGFGYAADRFSIRKVYAFCYVIELIGVCMLFALPALGTQALYAFVVIYGLTFGGGFALAPLIIGECFGLKSFGTIFGVLAIAGTTGGAIGPVLSGLIYDTTGAYSLAFVIFAISLVIAALAVLQARPEP